MMDAARLAPDTAKARGPATAEKQKASGAPSAGAAVAPAPVSSLAGITSQFPAPGPELADVVRLPHVPRANAAVSAEAPDGTPPPNAREASMTVLERHAAWFDRDGDGIVYARDTYRGFYEIGFNPLLSLVAALVIHATFSFWASPSLWSFLRSLPFGGALHLRMLDRGLHGSDARVYDTEGRFRSEAFESIFYKYGDSRARLLGQQQQQSRGGGHGGVGGPGTTTAAAAAAAEHDVITWPGILKMISRNRSIFDPTGWTATFLEWGGLFLIAADHEHGFMTKEDVRAMYDGSLWPRLAARVAARRGHGGTGAGRPHAT